jgi:hypothetical protein
MRNSRDRLSREILLNFHPFWHIELSVCPSNDSLPSMRLVFVLFSGQCWCSSGQTMIFSEFLSLKNDVEDQQCGDMRVSASPHDSPRYSVNCLTTSVN